MKKRWTYSSIFIFLCVLFKRASLKIRSRKSLKIYVENTMQLRFVFFMIHETISCLRWDKNCAQFAYNVYKSFLKNLSCMFEKIKIQNTQFCLNQSCNLLVCKGGGCTEKRDIIGPTSYFKGPFCSMVFYFLSFLLKRSKRICILLPKAQLVKFPFYLLLLAYYQPT